MVKMNSPESRMIYTDISDICNSQLSTRFSMVQDIEDGLFRITIEVHSSKLSDSNKLKVMNELGEVLKMVEVVYSVNTSYSITGGRYKLFLVFKLGERLIPRKDI